MFRFLLPLFLILNLAGCSPSNTPQAVGEYNLSRGDCYVEPCSSSEKRCARIRDKMTQDSCAMVEGKFVPRNHQEMHWF